MNVAALDIKFAGTLLYRSCARNHGYLYATPGLTTNVAEEASTSGTLGIQPALWYQHLDSRATQRPSVSKFIPAKGDFGNLLDCMHAKISM